MTIEELWQALEVEAATARGPAWLTRRATLQPGWPLLVALDPASRTRTLLLPAPRSTLPPRREWPECRGLEFQTLALGAETHCAVRLRDAAGADVFTALAEDLASRVAAAANGREAVAALFGRLRRWQQFLLAARAGLSREQERALWGELHVARVHLLPAFGPAATVEAWKATTAAHQDFQFSAGALEVKTTAAKQPQSVRITSERQLDDTGVGALFLHVVVLDERDVAPAGSTPGESLPALIATLRAGLSGEPAVVASFDDLLLDAGYLDTHAPRYEGRRRTVRRELTFRVRRGFPRLTERKLPAGIGDVSYALSLAACASFAVEAAAALTAFQSP
jgi:hypothetical protein